MGRVGRVGPAQEFGYRRRNDVTAPRSHCCCRGRHPRGRPGDRLCARRSGSHGVLHGPQRRRLAAGQRSLSGSRGDHRTDGGDGVRAGRHGHRGPHGSRDRRRCEPARRADRSRTGEARHPRTRLLGRRVACALRQGVLGTAACGRAGHHRRDTLAARADLAGARAPDASRSNALSRPRRRSPGRPGALLPVQPLLRPRRDAPLSARVCRRRGVGAARHYRTRRQPRLSPQRAHPGSLRRHGSQLARGDRKGREFRRFGNASLSRPGAGGPRRGSRLSASGGRRLRFMGSRARVRRDGHRRLAAGLRPSIRRHVRRQPVTAPHARALVVLHENASEAAPPAGQRSCARFRSTTPKTRGVDPAPQGGHRLWPPTPDLLHS